MITTNYKLPQDWTAEQATFIYDILADITEAIWETYENAILHRWRDQRGIPHPGNQLDPAPVSSPHDQYDQEGFTLDEEIPW